MALNKNMPSLKIAGYIQWDLAAYDGVYNTHPDNIDTSGSELGIRRARLIIQGRVDERISYRLMPNYNQKKQSVELLDAHIKYSGSAFGDITVGRFKDPFGMEALSSALWTPTLERSAITHKPTAVLAGLFIDSGIMLSKHKKNRGWSVALVKDGAEDEASKDLLGLTGRLYRSPFSSKHGRLHLGAAYALRDFESSSSIHWKTPISVAPARKLSWINTPTKKVSQFGLEFGFSHCGFGLQSEYIQSHFDAVTGVSQKADSGYVTLTYNTRSVNRTYRQGVFGAYGKNALSSPLLEWVIKVDHQRIGGADSEDKKADTLTLGLNAFMTKQLKIGFNWVKTSTEGFTNGVGSPDTGQAVIGRAQLKF